MNRLPGDPVMRFSWLNTQLRDHYESLEDLCRDMELSEEQIRASMEEAGFTYEPKINQFR
ncbi:MAG: DUF4250 domain-containing protein [Lachnospiraceae bacterium]|uniref:DUF4250 domain-containing protein n=1 Tax=Candidatus Enterocloster excrementigallinarum TaxID=2838558 RepID=A0A9D2PVN0_9FIRM|nr:DUF4250 domain-containing protein [Lachnospiraceae bacterium]HJC68024.1 DUF4250 domain-containing protein [Candidatus Enterocloster excrementigallinarum]